MSGPARWLALAPGRVMVLCSVIGSSHGRPGHVMAREADRGRSLAAVHPPESVEYRPWLRERLD